MGQPIFPYNKTSLTNLDINPEGELYGESIVFTGSISIPRSQAAMMASKLGCFATNTVTKNTTILIVGLQDSSKLAGYEKSAKHRKAEELLEKGLKIKILSEEDFAELHIK